jgi:mono/diheme cytochrome c family protein
MANNLSNEFSARCIDLRRMIGKVLARVGLTALFAVSIQAALAQQGDAVEEGRLQFIDKCAVCHGQEGKGDGVLAPSLDQQPTDLTRLSESNGGTFPRTETFNKIWGRGDEIISTHEMNEMPAFYVAPMLGNDKEFEDNAGRLSPFQIGQIIRFLETIQEQ